MKEFPPVPAVEDAPPALFESGHLWIQEYVDGGPLRFGLDDSGLIRFGDRSGVFDADDVPLRYRRAVRHVRERLDRDGLRAAVDDVGALVFFGTATFRRAVDYDWERLPPFLGTDVWSGSRGRHLPPDGVERGFDLIGLDPVNTFEREVRAVDFDPATYGVPPSNWRDGPAAGVVVRNKTGLRATYRRSDVAEGRADAGSDAASEPAAELARRFATAERFGRIADELEERDRPVAVDAVLERVLEAIAREAVGDPFDPDSGTDASALRASIAADVREFVEGR